MKKFARKLQQFSERAAQVQRAIDAAPAQAAQIRESVLATAGQIQLRSPTTNVAGAWQWRKMLKLHIAEVPGEPCFPQRKLWQVRCLL